MNCPLVNIHTHRPTGEAVEPTFAGVHPWEAGKASIGEIRPSMENADFVGETGLDFSTDVDREIQTRVFSQQLAIAQELSKPVVLHCVKAFEPMMEELAKHTMQAVIFHGFIGSVEQARRAAGCGYYLSFGERSLRSPRTVEALGQTPPQFLFAETDDSLIPITEIYRRIADIKGMTVNDLRCKIYANYQRVMER